MGWEIAGLEVARAEQVLKGQIRSNLLGFKIRAALYFRLVLRCGLVSFVHVRLINSPPPPLCPRPRFMTPLSS